MTKIQKSNLSGASSDAGASTPLDTPSSSADLTPLPIKHGISVTLDTKARPNQDSPDTVTSEETAATAISHTITALADKLGGGLVEWRTMILRDGRKGFVLFFSSEHWERNANGDIVPKGEL